MVDPAEIRGRLREFLGEKKYPTFVMHVPAHSDGTRLKFWMERAWERFEAANPDCKLTFLQIVDVFASCPQHGALIRRTRYLQLIGTWLTAHVDVGKLESENQFQDDRLGDRPVAFGFQSDQWQELKSQFRDGDQWYNFRSPPKTWANMAGRAGVALVRDGEVIDILVTSLN